MTGSIDPFEQDLRNALVAEVERQIARAQQRADEAAASGDEWYCKWHQDEADQLRATPYPWEKRQAA